MQRSGTSPAARAASEAVDWSGQLVLGPGMVLYVGPGGAAAAHAHVAVQVVRAFDAPVTFETADGPTTAMAAAMPSGVRHAFGTQAQRLALALVEPHGPRGRGVAAVARSLAGQDLTPRFAGLPEPRTIAEAGEQLLAALGATGDGRAPLSPHVRAALGYLDGAIGGMPRLDGAAAAAHVSPSQLRHLFTAQVGIPFRRFVLWLRLRRTVEAIATGANLTEAAHEAGFSDSAHLSRVFRQTFGLPPSTLLGMRVAEGAWPA